MPELIRHFAINADDVDATTAFYGGVFGWSFTPWGPPGFVRIDTAGEVIGVVQQRRVLDGRPTAGFECTLAVDDIAATEAAVLAAGGRIVMERAVIPGVGELLFFADPSGNIAGAMQFS